MHSHSTHEQAYEHNHDHGHEHKHEHEHKEAITFRLMLEDDIPAVSALVKRVFDEWVAPEYAPEGVEEFYRYITPEAFQARLQANHFGVVVQAPPGVVGMIEMRNYDHLSLLFVDRDFQKKGMAGELLLCALQICIDNRPDLRTISVNSSSFAVPVYEKLGFRRSEEYQVRNGIGFVPMLLNLPDQDHES